jgi:hypothetical protein
VNGNIGVKCQIPTKSRIRPSEMTVRLHVICHYFKFLERN